MNANMGLVDRIIRVVVAVVIAVAFFTGQTNGAFGLVTLIVALIFVVTAFTRFCPLYWPFRISSLKRKAPAKG